MISTSGRKIYKGFGRELASKGALTGCQDGVIITFYAWLVKVVGLIFE
jgi:hypothetical protein